MKSNFAFLFTSALLTTTLAGCGPFPKASPPILPAPTTANMASPSHVAIASDAHLKPETCRHGLRLAKCLGDPLKIQMGQGSSANKGVAQ